MTCANCARICGPEGYRRTGDTSLGYTLACESCEREYCGHCLADEPTFNADADCEGDPPRYVDCSTLHTCRKCLTDPHASDCKVWVNEVCDCAVGLADLLYRSDYV